LLFVAGLVIAGAVGSIGDGHASPLRWIVAVLIAIAATAPFGRLLWITR